MCKIVGNSEKLITGSEPQKLNTSIEGSIALQMLRDGNFNPESIDISEKGIVTFQDKIGNSFRSELTQAQGIEFLNLSFDKNVNFPNQKPNFSPLNDNLKLNSQAGSAQTKTPLFNDEHFKEQKPGEPLEIKSKNGPENTWKFNFSMGFNRTHYYDTDMHLKSSRIDVKVKDFSFQERTSDGFYNPANWQQPMDAFRWIDEPTNSFTVSAENKNNVYSLTAFHPKFTKYIDEVKQVTGTVDGVAVDQVMHLNEPFDGYNNKPGELHVVRFESTHMQMDWQLGYGRNINLINTEKYGKLVYTPSVYAGLTSGKHYDVYLKPNEYWEFDDNEDKMRIQGANVSIGNKLKYEYGRANIFVENKFTFSHLEHEYMDGKAEYNMKYNATTFGLGVNLYKTKPKTEIPSP